MTTGSDNQDKLAGLNQGLPPKPTTNKQEFEPEWGVQPNIAPTPSTQPGTDQVAAAATPQSGSVGGAGNMPLIGSAPPGSINYRPVAPGVSMNTAPRQSTYAVIALVLSSAAWVIAPIVASILALVFAHLATKEIRESNGVVEGALMARIAKIIAWINIIVMGIVFLFYCLFIVMIAL